MSLRSPVRPKLTLRASTTGEQRERARRRVTRTHARTYAQPRTATRNKVRMREMQTYSSRPQPPPVASEQAGERLQRISINQAEKGLEAIERDVDKRSAVAL